MKELPHTATGKLLKTKLSGNNTGFQASRRWLSRSPASRRWRDPSPLFP
jgi:hypothetical protein